MELTTVIEKAHALQAKLRELIGETDAVAQAAKEAVQQSQIPTVDPILTALTVFVLACFVG